MPPGPDPTFSLLLVCTGNICRSAFGERLGRAYLDQALGDAAAEIRITSAGTHAVVGSAMHPDSALVLEGFGGEPGGFTARQITDGHVMDADLVLTMTRAHRKTVLALAPRALARTFTLREAADLIGILGDDADLAAGAFADRARGLVRELSNARSRRRPGEGDDVADPIGKPIEAHQEAGEALAEALIPVLARLVALRATAA